MGHVSKRRICGPAALPLVALLAACAACGDDPPLAGGPVTVTLSDAHRRPLADLPVIVAGRKLTTDASGAAHVDDAPASYDLVFESPKDGHVYAYEGLTERKPSLISPFDFEPDGTSSARIVTGSPDAETVTLVATADDWSVEISGGAGNIELHWPSGPHAAVHLTALSFDTNEGRYKGRAVADVTVNAGDTLTFNPTWVPLDATTLPTTTLRVAAADGSAPIATAFFASRSFAFPPASAASGALVVTRPPLQLPLYLHVGSTLPNGARIDVDVPANGADIPEVTLPSAIDALTPDDAAIATSATSFTTSGHGTLLVDMAPADAASANAPRITIVSVDSAHIPDLEALGIHPPAGARLQWRATLRPDDTVATAMTAFDDADLPLRRSASTPVRTFTLITP